MTNATFVNEGVPYLQEERGYATKHHTSELGDYVMIDFEEEEEFIPVGESLWRSFYCEPWEVRFNA